MAARQPKKWIAIATNRKGRHWRFAVAALLLLLAALDVHLGIPGWVVLFIAFVAGMYFSDAVMRLVGLPLKEEGLSFIVEWDR